MTRRFRANLAIRRWSLRSVHVVMLDGIAIDGCLHDSKGDVVVLVAASIDTPDNGRVELDGHVVIDRRQIRFLQVLDPLHG